MSDREIIQGLIDRDNHITGEFLFSQCRPLLGAIMRNVFNGHVEYDEMVSLLYDYLVADDCAKLRQFQFRSSLYQWLKVVSTRFFISHRDAVIGNFSKEPSHYRWGDDASVDLLSNLSGRMDVHALLAMMDNRRYAYIIKSLMLDEFEPMRYAEEIGVTLDNLYNIKKRAMAAFSQLAIKYYSYGK